MVNKMKKWESNNDELGLNMSQFINDQVLYSDEEINKLFKEYRDGSEEAYEKIFNGNIKLVRKVAANKKYNFVSIPLSDRFQIGCIGLIKAIKLFDENKQFKFSTYATIAIDGTIKRELGKQFGNIKIPYSIKQLREKVLLVREETYKSTGKRITIPEIAEELSISEEQLKELILYPYNIKSLDEKNSKNEDDEICLMNIIFDKDENFEDEVIEKIFNEQLKERILEVLSTPDETDDHVTDRSIQVFKMRYGFETGKIMLQKEVGKVLGVSKQSIFAHEKKCINKIRRALQKENYY